MGNAKVLSVLPVIDGIYQNICRMEAEFQILGLEGDFRPRIEYYHDAVRALTSGESSTSKHSRLSVERLAYDVSMLRTIISKPLHAGRGNGHLSANNDLVTNENATNFCETSSEVRSELSRLYKDYTVLFVALLAEKADYNSQIRTEEADVIIADCFMLQEMLQKFDAGKIDRTALIAAADALEHDELRRTIKTILQQPKLEKIALTQVQGKLQTTKESLRQEIKTINHAGLNFATGRLAVYEDAKETVKRLANEGLNVAGKFVEGAMQQSTGRGRGV